MNQKILHDYFSFTKKERVGIICLVVIMLALFVSPQFFPVRKPVKLPVEYLMPVQNLASGEEARGVASRDKPFPTQNKYLASSLDRSRLFYFDPNVLGAAGWKKIGLRPRTIQTIQHYLARGGRFKSPQDLSKIYGLRAEEVNTLLPFVVIKSEGNPLERHFAAPAFTPTRKPERETSIVDINSADSNALIALPGIGSKLANRIIRFRESLGGFYTVDQVGEVYGLPDSILTRIRSRLTVGAAPQAMLDLNTATEDLLKAHPYVRWNLARRIIAYREQHGRFTSIDGLKQLEGVDSATFNRLAPYLLAAQ